MTTQTEKMACTIFSFDRPNYLKQTLDSIEVSYHTCKNYLDKNQIEIEFFVLQDGLFIGDSKKGSEKGFKESQDVIEEFRRKSFAKICTWNVACNVGIGKQKFSANELCKLYEKIMFFEDDMILSPYYFRILLALNKRFPRCAVTACDRTGGIPKDDFKNHLHKAVKSKCHWWGYLMPRRIIEKLQPMLNKYINVVGKDYRKRPVGIIKETFNMRATSHDAIIDKVMREYDFKKVTTYVPRAKYIGENGMHANTHWFNKHKFNIEKPYIFDEDANIETFELITKGHKK